MGKDSVKNVSGRMVRILYEMREYSTGKAILSRLRNSIGRSYLDMPEVMSFIFENLPEHFLGNSKNLSDEELCILTCLQLYAIHQQGEKRCVFDEEKGYSNIGTSLKALRMTDDSTSVDRRFNAMITSIEFAELTVHLRHMIRLLKSKQFVPIDYGRLAKDLYGIKKNKDNIILSWAREYYKNGNKGEQDGE